MNKIFLWNILILNSIHIYNMCVSVYGLTNYEHHKQRYIKPRQTFCILIPCHNEQDVIEQNIISILNSDYDINKLHIYVIADNCSDNTVTICNELKSTHNNVNIIEVNGGSKPKAINNAIQYLKHNSLWIDDNIVIIDSDNKVSKGMFSAFNHYHQFDGILQCRINSDNHDAFVSKGFKSAFENMRYSFQLSRNCIGLSGSLCGTGFSVNREIFDDVGFESCNSLTEDLEFSMLCVLNGHKIKYIDEQYVLNQNLDELKPSIKQRIRWCRGHSDVFFKMSHKLLFKYIKTFKLQYLDSFLFLFNPFRCVWYIMTLFLSIFFISQYPNIIMLNILMSVYYIYYIIHSNRFRLSYIIPHLFYAFCMMLIIPYSCITYRNRVWVKTKHKKIIKNG